MRALRDGHELPLGPPQQQAVLALLALRRGRAIGAGELIGALWGEAPPPRALGTVRTYVSRLRKLLEPARPPRAPATVLVSAGDGYALRLPADAADAAAAVAAVAAVDADRFEGLVAQAAAARADGDAGRAHALLSQGLGLWRGSALAGLRGPFVERERGRLGELRVSALEELYGCALDLGRHAAAAPALGELVGAHPLRERLRVLQMVALYRSGRQSEALTAYAEARRVLADELGVAPGPELTATHARVLAADPGLDPPRPTAAEPPPVVRPRQLPPSVPDFTGRAADREELRHTLLRAGSGQPPAPACAVITGIAGVGKTALALHVGHLVRDHFPDGTLYAELRGLSGRPGARRADRPGTGGAAPDEAGPGLLHEAGPSDSGTVLGAFLEALGVEREAVPEQPEQRAALYRSLLSERRVLVVLNNAHDGAQVAPLLPGTGASAALVTARNRSLVLPGCRPVALDAMAEDEAVALLAAIAGERRTAAEPEAARALVAACGRLPLALRIVGARLAGRPGWSLAALLERLADERRRLDELQVGDLDVAAAFRLGQQSLTPEAARAFRLLSVADAPELPLAAAAALLDTDEETARDQAEQLVDAGLLEECGPDRYGFHDLVRLSARRQCERLESADVPRAAALRLIDHVLATVRGAYAWLEPHDILPGHCRTPDRPGTPLADADAARRWVAAEADLVTRTIAQAAAEATATREALRAAGDLACLWFFLVPTPARQHDLVAVLTPVIEAAERLGELWGQGRARYVRGRTSFYWTRVPEASERDLSAALRLAREADDPLGLARAANQLGSVLLTSGRPARAVSHFARARDGFFALGDTARAGRCCVNIARARLALGDAAASRSAAEQGVALAAPSGSVYGTAYAHYQFGHILTSTGDPEAAEPQLLLALDGFERAGRRVWAALTRGRLAECALARGLPERAAGYAEAALAEGVAYDSARCQALAHAALGRSLLDRDRPAEARDHLRTAHGLFVRHHAVEADEVHQLLTAITPGIQGSCAGGE
ncbi:BTAD domain-containing putative transcriptional regulator [Streptomyces sp. NPDC059009]|uniref:AfsR/SARP family transcriptional regulator n=1 Tax=Streptomyces sp. NPDC059009 TaxID=3346694 RepID=UPI00369DC5AD